MEPSTYGTVTNMAMEQRNACQGYAYINILVYIHKHTKWFSMRAKVEPSAYGAKRLWNRETHG